MPFSEKEYKWEGKTNSILDQVLKVVLTGGGSERHRVTDGDCSISSTQGVVEVLETDSFPENMRRYQE